MITREFSLNQMPGYPFEHEFDLAKMIFFDIETTGFAAEATYLYLIGCAYYKDSSFYIIQWFSEGIKEEPLLITTFFEFIKAYYILVHYNGSGFDIPYLLRKCKLLNLDYNFDSINSIDIYKKIFSYKKALRQDESVSPYICHELKSLKLKSVEAFLNIRRKDEFDGGELIQVYQSYLGKKHYEDLRKMRDPKTDFFAPSESELLLHQLLLHNEDDIKGLLFISPILNYVDLFEKPIRILQAVVEQGVLSIRFETSAVLPIPISFGNDHAHLTAYNNSALLTVSIFEGELKYFYDNYKDYYYLTSEDYAIHKSLASFVDKEYKTKAKSSNCYIKKQGLFVPQFSAVLTPCFKTSHTDKVSYLEVHTDFLLQEENLEQYVTHILAHLLSR